MAVIEVKNASIKYVTGDLKAIGFKEYVLRKLTGRYEVKDFWADKNISFTLEKGDMLGIIGSNGAGKSTLLKAVSGIMDPAEGSVKVKGKIAALLELASGFDGEMTIRENAYLRGAMLGYTRKFMDEKYDDIIRFAELEKFQDYQFKQLSSGMKSRLAFSIACLVDPDVLILDEVLAVGDGAFRQKSKDKMKTILEGGVTGILVSHSSSQIEALCNKILWIDHGKQVTFTEDVDTALKAYEEFLITKKLPKKWKDIEKLAEDYEDRIERERDMTQMSEVVKLKAILEAGDEKSAIRAAESILYKHAPDTLSPNEIARIRSRNKRIREKRMAARDAQEQLERAKAEGNE